MPLFYALANETLWGYREQKDCSCIYWRLLPFKFNN